MEKSPSPTNFPVKGDIECAHQACEEILNCQKGMSSAKDGEGTVTPTGTSQILTMPYVWTIATFLGVYQGAETIGQGFIVTFLLHERVR